MIQHERAVKFLISTQDATPGGSAGASSFLGASPQRPWPGTNSRAYMPSMGRVWHHPSEPPRRFVRPRGCLSLHAAAGRRAFGRRGHAAAASGLPRPSRGRGPARLWAPGARRRRAGLRGRSGLRGAGRGCLRGAYCGRHTSSPQEATSCPRKSAFPSMLSLQLEVLASARCRWSGSDGRRGGSRTPPEPVMDFFVCWVF